MDKFLDKKSEAKIRERISTDCAGGNPTLPIPVALFHQNAGEVYVKF
jgi:hypothetical protein